MADERISYEMLQDMLRSERRSNKLGPVQSRFWHDVRTFLEEVMETFRQEQQKDPFSRRVMMVTDEVKHARQAAESLWALRERKMSLYALSQVRETNPNRPDGLTPDEERIYDHILKSLLDGRNVILHGGALPKAGSPVKDSAPQPRPHQQATPQVRKEPAAPPTPRPPAGDAPPAPPPAPEPPAQPVEVPADTPDAELITIRALSNIPAFVGPDMQTYLLKEGDVASVPEPIAKLLEKRKKAAVIDLG